MDPTKEFLRLTYAGLTDGALLALIALGLVLIYKATDVINFAHGEFMLLGAYVMYELMVVQALPLPVGLIFGILILVGVGVLVERVVLRPLIGEPVISVIMVTIGLSNIIKAIVGILWGPNPPGNLPDIVPKGPLLLFEGTPQETQLGLDKIYTAILVLIIVFLLIAFFRRSKQGIAIRAAADDQQAAMSMGISITTVFRLTWSIGAVTAGIAGLLVANLSGVGPLVASPALRAFPVIILGGLDSIPGAVVGGFIIGLLENYSTGYLVDIVANAPFLAIFLSKEVVPYVVLIVILMFRPYGLFGQKIIERV